MKVKVTDTNMYCNTENIFSNENMYEEDVPYNYEDEDAFSDVDYDSDDCEASLRRSEDDDSEDEIWEEEDEDDEEISNAIRLQLLREKNKKQLKGLSALEGKLNWLEKVPVTESDLDNDDYPVLGAIVKPKKSRATKARTPNTSPKRYVPATITVCMGTRTYIEFEHVICKAIKEGRTCAYGDKCKFSHDLPKPKIDYSTRLCNFIKNGEKCKFEGRCKFSHDIKLLKPSGDKKTTEQKAPKPMCRNGLKCANRKCTFTHPPGHKKAPQPQLMATKSPARVRTPNSSPHQPLEAGDKKFLLCKNMFKVEGGAIKVIGECRFGDECKFAHSRIEVEKKIIKCLHKDCKGVEIEFITKKDKDGKERKTRRYKNSATRKCSKIHEKERVTDFIVRTQGARA